MIEALTAVQEFYEEKRSQEIYQRTESFIVTLMNVSRLLD